MRHRRYRRGGGFDEDAPLLRSPTSAARILAPRRRANSKSSKIRPPAPSPMTNPSRAESQGRLAFSGASFLVERARMAANPPTPMGVMAASVPPAIITSASQRAMILKASPTEWALEVQAVHVASFGPLAR